MTPNYQHVTGMYAFDSRDWHGVDSEKILGYFRLRESGAIEHFGASQGRMRSREIEMVGFGEISLKDSANPRDLFAFMASHRNDPIALYTLENDRVNETNVAGIYAGKSFDLSDLAKQQFRGIRSSQEFRARFVANLGILVDGSPIQVNLVRQQ